MMPILAPRDVSIPLELRPWLYAYGSLTRQLTQLGGGAFHVEPCAEYFTRIEQGDAVWLKVNAQQLGWARETLLYGCEETPWVHARSFFPMQTLQGRGRIFRHLGKRAIGHVLFQRTQPDCNRRVFLSPQGWTRQSCYLWHGYPLLVQETFLAAFCEFIRQSPDRLPFKVLELS